MDRAVVAAALVVAAVVAALLLQRRRPAAIAGAPPTWAVPTALDRADFARPEAPWLVAVFTSATCGACADTVAKAQVLAGPEVAVDDVEVGRRGDVHRRYGVDAVPMVVVADAEGVVRGSFVGPPSATDLWAAVAELRSPGTRAQPG